MAYTNKDLGIVELWSYDENGKRRPANKDEIRLWEAAERRRRVECEAKNAARINAARGDEKARKSMYEFYEKHMVKIGVGRGIRKWITEHTSTDVFVSLLMRCIEDSIKSEMFHKIYDTSIRAGNKQ